MNLGIETGNEKSLINYHHGSSSNHGVLDLIRPRSIYGKDETAHKPSKPRPTVYDRMMIFELAASASDLEDVLEKLQTLDFNPNEQQNEDGDFIIHVAAKQGVCQLPLIIPLVNTYQADVNLSNTSGMTSLMIAAQLADHVLADVLLCVLRAHPDMRNPHNGYSALHYAALRDSTACISVLVKRGADFNLDDYLNMRPDDLALKHGSTDAADLIQMHRKQRLEKVKESIEQDLVSGGRLRDSDLFTVDEDGYTLIMTAAMCNGVKALDALCAHAQAPINAQHEKTLRTALCYAAAEGHVEAVELLLSAGAESCIRDMEGLLALHHAILNNRPHVVTAMLDKSQCLHGLHRAQSLTQSPDILKVVRAAVARRQREIVTPVLFECAMSGDADKLYCILDEGDCVNPLSGMCQWPLYLAVENENLDVIKLLCENGADIHRKHTSSGNSVLHLACSRGYYDVSKYLLQQYSKQNTEGTTDKNANDVTTGGAEKVVNEFNYDGKTPVILAAEKGHSRVVVLLLQYGASTAVLDSTGALYECTQYDGCQSLIEKNRQAHTKLVMSALLCKDGLKKLRQIFMPEFDHNLRDQNGNTPLMVAAYHQKQHIIKFLLQSAVFVAEYMRNRRDSKCKSYDMYQADSGTSSAKTNSCGGNNTSGCQAGLTGCHGHPEVSCEHAGMHADSLMGPDSWLHCPTCTQNCSCNHSKSKFTSSEKLHRHLDSPMKESSPFHETIPEEENQENHEPTTAEVERYDELLHMLQMRDSDILQPNGELPPEDDPEKTLADNMTSLFDSMRNVHRRSSIFLTDIMVSHLCAVNSKDGVTVFHRLIEGGDNVNVLDMLLEADHSGINIQDNHGLSPLHVACLMKRKKIVEKLAGLTYVDLNSRTLDGKLAEEMTEDKNIIRLVKKARSAEPNRSLFSPLMSLSTSLFGSSSYMTSEESLDFERINSQFAQMKRGMNPYPLYNDRNMLFSFY